MVTSTLTNWGNSQGILIPKRICEDAGLRIGDSVIIDVKDGDILMKRPDKPRYQRRRKVTIEELFEGYDGDYHPEETDWGTPVGKEMW